MEDVWEYWFEGIFHARRQSRGYESLGRNKPEHLYS